jgi:hypothetical protein
VPWLAIAGSANIELEEGLVCEAGDAGAQELATDGRKPGDLGFLQV